MVVSIKTQKALWARAGGRCTFPDCRRTLIIDPREADDESLVGEVCHIVAKERSGPRGDYPLDLEDRDKYDNLILLCRVHHKLIDDQPATYAVDCLKKMKAAHEKWVSEALKESSLEPPERAREAKIVLSAPREKAYEWGVEAYAGDAPLAVGLFVNFYLQNKGGAAGMLEEVTLQDAILEPESLISLSYTGIRKGFRIDRFGEHLKFPMQVPPGHMSPVCCYFRAQVAAEEPEAFAQRLRALKRFRVSFRIRGHGQEGAIPDAYASVVADFDDLKRGICRWWSEERGREDLVAIVKGQHHGLQ